MHLLGFQLAINVCTQCIWIVNRVAFRFTVSSSSTMHTTQLAKTPPAGASMIRQNRVLLWRSLLCLGVCFVSTLMRLWFLHVCGGGCCGWYFDSSPSPYYVSNRASSRGVCVASSRVTWPWLSSAGPSIVVVFFGGLWFRRSLLGETLDGCWLMCGSYPIAKSKITEHYRPVLLCVSENQS